MEKYAFRTNTLYNVNIFDSELTMKNIVSTFLPPTCCCS